MFSVPRVMTMARELHRLKYTATCFFGLRYALVCLYIKILCGFLWLKVTSICWQTYAQNNDHVFCRCCCCFCTFRSIFSFPIFDSHTHLHEHIQLYRSHVKKQRYAHQSILLWYITHTYIKSFRLLTFSAKVANGQQFMAKSQIQYFEYISFSLCHSVWTG